jgi:hypothetical protein
MENWSEFEEFLGADTEYIRIFSNSLSKIDHFLLNIRIVKIIYSIRNRFEIM